MAVMFLFSDPIDHDISTGHQHRESPCVPVPPVVYCYAPATHEMGDKSISAWSANANLLEVIRDRTVDVGEKRVVTDRVIVDDSPCRRKNFSA